MLIVLFCYRGALGVTVWGNEEIHNGVSDAIYSLGTINNRIQSLTNKVGKFAIPYHAI